MSGDWLRHNFSILGKERAVPAFSALAQLLSTVHGQVFALPNFQGALGNNDFIPDYHFDLSKPAHPLLQNQSHVLGNLSLLQPSEVDIFGKCGYYAREAESGLLIIVLNTVLWCLFLDPPLSVEHLDPCGQFRFLEQQLIDARMKSLKVHINAHIPPGINLYGALQQGLSASYPEIMYWRDDFVSRYSALLKQFRDVVAVQWFGHTHQFSFLAMSESFGDDGPPGFVVPSITPLFGNNPSYLVASVDTETWALHRLQQRSLSEETLQWEWGPLSINAVLGIGPDGLGSNKRLREAALTLATNNTRWEQFNLIHDGGFPRTHIWPFGDCDTKCRRLVACSMVYLSLDEIRKCTQQTPPSAGKASLLISEEGILLLVFMVVVVLVGVAMAYALWKRKEYAEVRLVNEDM
jgi:hypothetical protein